MRASDPGIPAGYVLQSTSDGSIDRAQQTFGLGGHSGQTVLNDGIIDNSRPTFP